MDKITNFEILRDVPLCNRGAFVLLPREPLMVCTLLDESAFHASGHIFDNKVTHLEDRMHDWDWSGGRFRFFPRGEAVTPAVLIIYDLTNIPAERNFCMECGARLINGQCPQHPTEELA